MCSHCLENHWQFLRDDKLFTHMPYWFAISEYMKYVKQDLLFFRALLLSLMVFYGIFTSFPKKIYSSGLPLPARHYHTNQRWRLPQLPGQTASFPRPFEQLIASIQPTVKAATKLGILEGSPMNPMMKYTLSSVISTTPLTPSSFTGSDLGGGTLGEKVKRLQGGRVLSKLPLQFQPAPARLCFEKRIFQSR